MEQDNSSAELLIVGAGLAGLVTAYEWLDQTTSGRVIILDKDKRVSLGGLARESFGGVHMIDTPQQRKMRIHDNPELAFQDWESFAQFTDQDRWPKEWAKFYCETSISYIYEFLVSKKITFLPIVNWPERGFLRPGNSVPRWHIAWGTGAEIVYRLLRAINEHHGKDRLKIICEQDVSGLLTKNGQVTGVRVRDLTKSGSPEREFYAENTVLASGGICGGDLSMLRKNWYRPWGEAPKRLLNGAHDFADGQLHLAAKSEVGANLTYLDRQWHYAAGIHHPAKRRPNDGLSLVPPRSALWMNARGERIGPPPLVGYTDTRYLVESILKEPGQYSWQIMNRKIALKELAVSGSDFMTAFRNKNKIKLIQQLLFGNHELVNRLIRECPEDIVVAESLDRLMDLMDARSLDGLKIDRQSMRDSIRDYDMQIDQGADYFKDDQLRRLMNFRLNRGDRIRMCKSQKIIDKKAIPLIAIREFILARKSLGGIQTNLRSEVLREDGTVVDGLYAVGESAGFGGGGIHGMGSLEGTFLGACILTGRSAAQVLAGKI